MKVIILFNEIRPDQNRIDDEDVLVQCQAVSESLCNLGHTVQTVPASLDLQAVREKLQRIRPDVVFNLVESLGGSDRMMPCVPLLLSSLSIPFTGCGAETMLISGDKIRCKQLLFESGIDSPMWFERATGRWVGSDLEAAPLRYIVKSIFEHASIGINDDSVFDWIDSESTERNLVEFESRTGYEPFAEAYIDGREFNLSLLESEEGLTVLSPAEIDFSQLPADKMKIVGYAAKWEPESIEFRGTPRTFDFADSDDRLTTTICAIAKKTSQLIGICGYARVDFRVDLDGVPFVLEVNANPCLSPDAGFAAALEQTGIGFDDAIARLIKKATTTELEIPRCS